MIILITGATGFVGSHLIDSYLNEDCKIYATKKFRSDMSNVEHLLHKEKVEWITMDVTDAHSVENVIKKIQPDIIHHLAAQSFVPESWICPSKTFEVNLFGTLNIFEAVKQHSPNSVVHITSSSEVYGIPKVLPITEELLPKPISPYGVSKLSMDRLGVQYNRSYGIKTVITRAFNHTGTRRNENFVCSSFAKQIVEIERNKKEHILVGNLDAIRDFTDVKDICSAYKLAVKYCNYGDVYNICSGKAVVIKEILSKLVSFSVSVIKVEEDETKLRPSDLHTLQGDCTKFKEKTGWKPIYSLDTTLKELLDYWREKIA